MSMMNASRLNPIYASGGEVRAFVQFPYLFNREGEWIGWVTSSQQVYSVHGTYVGWLTKEPRIIRKRSSGYLKPRLAPPPEPERIKPPASVPLAPMMSELPIGTFDVLEDTPDLLPPKDFGDLREDMD
jgi:hypothetical protein